MAELVQKVAAAIRQNSPDALIVFNGMAETTEKIIHYWQTCKNALNGSWPVDALAVHPYTFVATEEGAPFDWAWFAWSDNMRNAGMVKSDGTPKPHLFDAFQQVRDRTIL